MSKLYLSKDLDFYGSINPNSSCVEVNKIKHELLDYDFEVSEEVMEDILFLKEFGLFKDIRISKMQGSMKIDVDQFDNYIFELTFLKWKY